MIKLCAGMHEWMDVNNVGLYVSVCVLSMHGCMNVCTDSCMYQPVVSSRVESFFCPSSHPELPLLPLCRQLIG